MWLLSSGPTSKLSTFTTTYEYIWNAFRKEKGALFPRIDCSCAGPILDKTATGCANYLMPDKRCLTPLNMYTVDAIYEKRLRYKKITADCWPQLWNKSMQDYHDNAIYLCNRLECRYLQKYFIRYRLSLVQPDCFESCAHLQMHLDGAKRSLKYLNQNGSG